MELLPYIISCIFALSTFAYTKVNCIWMYIVWIECRRVNVRFSNRMLTQESNSLQIHKIIECKSLNSVYLLWDSNILQLVDSIECLCTNCLNGWRQQCIVCTSLCRRERNQCLLILAQQEAVNT